MLAENLPTHRVWRAIDVYMTQAYDGAIPPSAVRKRLETLRALPAEEFYTNPAFERNEAEATSGAIKLSLRLGNRIYPHMKLTIERSPDKQGFLFRADTHDKHCCPAAGTREHGAFCELMERNQQLAQEIETAWAAEGVPTFKTYLKEDLARRANTAP